MFDFFQEQEQQEEQQQQQQPQGQQQQQNSPFLPVLSLTDSPTTTNHFDYNITDTQHNIGYTNANQSNNFITTLPLYFPIITSTTTTSPLLSSSPVANKNLSDHFNSYFKGQTDSNLFENNNNNNNNISNLNTINNINNNININNNSSVSLLSPRISFPQTIQQQQRQRNSTTNINNTNNFLISNNTTNLSDTITTTPNFLGDNLNTPSEFGTYTLTAATPTVPTVGTPSTPYFNTPYISTSRLSPSYISTPPYINSAEEADYNSSITSTPFIPPTPLTTFNTPYNRNNNNITSNNNNSNNNILISVNDSDPNIYDSSGQSPWFPLFPTSSQDSQPKSQLREEEDTLQAQTYIGLTEQLQQLNLQPHQHRYSCSSTPLIFNLDQIMEMGEIQNSHLSQITSNSINNNEINDNDHNVNNNNDNINTSNLTINQTSPEIVTTTTSSPSLAPKSTLTSPINTKQSSSLSPNNNNNINSLLNTSFSLIKREESNNNSSSNIDETISLTQKILSSASSPSTISSNPGGMISTVHNNPRLMVVNDGSVGVNTIAATSTSSVIRKHENQLDHLTEQEQQRNKKRPRTSVTEQQQEDDTEEKKHHCPECGRGFNRKFNMQTHRSTHDPNRIKPFACEYSNCGSRFTRKHDLKRHINGIHKGEKVHECGVCRKPFSRKDAWKRHVTTCGKI